MNDSYDNAKRNHRVKDNRWGLTHHILATASYGHILGTECEKARDAITSVTEKFIKKSFSADGSYLRIPCVTMHADRGCWAWDAVVFYYKLGHVFGAL